MKLFDLCVQILKGKGIPFTFEINNQKSFENDTYKYIFKSGTIDGI